MQLTGSATSSPLGTSLPVLSIPEASKTSPRAILMALLNATSSPALASGAMRFVAPAGQMTDLFGPVPVLANLSARQAKALGLLTSGTCGQHGTTSSKSASLQSSLESRLRAATQCLGSTLFKMTWKAWATPSGRSRSRLRASVLRTSETGCTSWPTPVVNDAAGSDYAYSQGNHDKVVLKLGGAAKLASWATPATRDWHSASGSQEFLASRLEQARGKPLSEQAFTLAHWSTPLAADGNKADCTLQAVERRALAGGWLSTAMQARLSGQMPNGSHAETARPGQLNPAHSRWLMALPPEWDACAPTATRSTPKRRASGSNL